MPDSIALAVASFGFGVGEFNYPPVIASSSWATSYVSPVYYPFADVSFSADNFSHASYTLITDASFEIPSYQSTYLFGNVILSAYVFTEPPLTYTGDDATKRCSGLVSIEPAITATGGIVLRGTGTVSASLEIASTGINAVHRGIGDIAISPEITATAKKTVRGGGQIDLDISVDSRGSITLRGNSALELYPEITEGKGSITLRGNSSLELLLDVFSESRGTTRSTSANVVLGVDVSSSGKIVLKGLSNVTLAPEITGAGKIPLIGFGSFFTGYLVISSTGYNTNHKGIGQIHSYFAVTSTGRITASEHYGSGNLTSTLAITATGKVDPVHGSAIIPFYGFAGYQVSYYAITGIGYNNSKHVTGANIVSPNLTITSTGFRYSTYPSMGNVSVAPVVTSTGKNTVIHTTSSNISKNLVITSTGTCENSLRLVVTSYYGLYINNEFESSYSSSPATVTFESSYADYAELNVEMSYGMAATITGNWAASYHLLQNSTATYELKYTLLAVNGARQEFSFSYSMADTLPYEPPVPPGFQIPPPIPVE